MNKMYEYLLNHNYISFNKKPCKNGLYKQQEMSEQRAGCIVNKYNSLTEELKNQINQLQQEKEELIKYCNNEQKRLEKEIHNFGNKPRNEYSSILLGKCELIRNILSKLKEGDKDVKLEN